MPTPLKLLLDESLPRKLAQQLTAHSVSTVQQMGWSGVTNGELLRRAADSRFDVLITGDQNMSYQQNSTTLPIAVLVLVAKNNKLESFLPLVPRLLDQLTHLTTRSFTVLSDQ